MGMKPRAKIPQRQYYSIVLTYPNDAEEVHLIVSASGMDEAEKLARQDATESHDSDVFTDEWEFESGALLERCEGCGGLRKTASPKGMGAV